MATDHELIRDWLKALGVLTAGAMNADEVSVRLDAMTPHLAEEFEPSAYNQRSLHAVATQCRYFPTYGELVPLLREWQRSIRDCEAIPADPQGLTEEDHAMARNWQRHATNNWGKVIPRNVETTLRTELARYRSKRERVYDHLVANDDRAKRIALRAGWLAPLRAAADAIHSETRRGPPLDNA